MRELTRREKTLLAIVGLICLAVLLLRGLPTILHGLTGSMTAEKREQLQTAENLVLLNKQADRIDESLRELVGLQGRLISDSLFDEISQANSVQTLNQTRQESDLIALHPALEGKAPILLAYKNQRGGFAKLEELKTIQGSIFEGEQPRVVISQRISQLARKSGLKPDYQLNIKPSPGKKTEKISREAKRNFVLYSYMKGLEDELKRLKEQEKQEAELSQEQSDGESELERAMLEGWWGDSDSVKANDGDSKDGVSQEANPSKDEAAGDADFNGNSASDRIPAKNRDLSKTKDWFRQEDLSFAQLPTIIPIELRVPLIEFILSFITSELNGTTESKRGFFSNQISRVNEGSPRKFLEFGQKASGLQVRLRENSALLAKFEDLIRRYEATQINYSGESIDGVLNYEEQIMALTEYVDDTQLQIKQLENWLAGVSLTYQPELYGVEMKFKSGVGTMVKLIELIDVSTKWLYVRNLKIINDKSEKKEGEERARLSVELSMVAKIL